MKRPLYVCVNGEHVTMRYSAASRSFRLERYKAAGKSTLLALAATNANAAWSGSH